MHRPTDPAHYILARLADLRLLHTFTWNDFHSPHHAATAMIERTVIAAPGRLPQLSW